MKALDELDRAAVEQLGLVRRVPADDVALRLVVVPEVEVARLGAWDEVNKLAISHPGSAKFKRDGLLPLHHVCNRRCPNPNVYHNLIQAYPDALIDVAQHSIIHVIVDSRYVVFRNIISS